jgi:hypothetical protein
MSEITLDPTNLRLGKQEYKFDPRTLKLGRYVQPEIRIPEVFDFDKDRAPIPLRVWGNDNWGDCVIAGEANQIFRLERVEQRRTVVLTDADAIKRYQSLTGSKEAGDDLDQGLVVLDSMRDWHHNGFHVDGIDKVRWPRAYEIAAYGELEPTDEQQLRAACYLMHGVHFGLWLPRAAQQMTREGVWHYDGQTGPEWEAGSWGGHLVYSKAFNPDAMEILTWGEKVMVTNEFLAKYCDEAWAVVDNLDSWRVKQTIDVKALTATLRQITSKVDG